MRKNPKGARLFMSPEQQAKLRAEVAVRRRNLLVNSAILGARHVDDLLALASARLGREGLAALTEIITALADGERWTDATTRRLRAALAPLRRACLADGPPDDREGLAWQLARLDELVAQYEALRHFQVILEMSKTERPPARSSRKIREAHLAAGRRARPGTDQPPSA